MPLDPAPVAMFLKRGAQSALASAQAHPSHGRPQRHRREDGRQGGVGRAQAHRAEHETGWAPRQAYGGTESDYRPERWTSFREDYRFTGKEEDSEVGLQYFGKRYLNPLLGRWISADPLAVHAPGQADLNLYAYVSGSVLKNVDPLGLAPEAAAAEAGMSVDLDYGAIEGQSTCDPNTSCASGPTWNMEEEARQMQQRMTDEADSLRAKAESESQERARSMELEHTNLIKNEPSIDQHTMEALGQVQKGALMMSGGAALVAVAPMAGAAAAALEAFGGTFAFNAITQQASGEDVSGSKAAAHGAVAAATGGLLAAPIRAAMATETTAVGVNTLRALNVVVEAEGSMVADAVIEGQVDGASLLVTGAGAAAREATGDAADVAVDAAEAVVGVATEDE